MAAASSIARWLLNEASSGTTPTTVYDDQGSNDLTIDYSSGDANWTSIAAGNGLDFTAAPITTNSAIATLEDISTNGNIASSLDGVTEASLIVVANIDNGDNFGCRLFCLQTGAVNGDFSLVAEASSLVVRWDNDNAGYGEAFYTIPSGLTTIGVSIDTTEVVGADRVKVYYNGVLQSRIQLTDIPQNKALTSINNTNRDVCIGNRPSLNRNVDGQVYYVELFTGILTAAQHSDAHTALASNNDTNWAATTAPTITAANTQQSQQISNATLSVSSTALSVQSVSQSNTISAPAFIQHYLLVANSLNQSQQIESPGLTQNHTLSASNLNQSSSIENIELTQAHILTTENLAQSSSLENAVLTVSGSLAVSAINQAQTVSTGSLTQKHNLAVSGINQNAIIETTLLNQINALIAQNIQQQQTALEPQLTQHSLLNINNLLQSSGIESPLLSILGQLTPDGITQAQLLNAVALTQHNLLLCDDLIQAAKLENITLDISQALTVLGIDQAQSVGNSTLSTLNTISVDAISQSQLIDVVSFGGAIIGYLNGRLVLCSSINGTPTITNLIDAKPTFH